METIFESGTTLILLLQNIGEGFITLMKGFTFLGNEEFFLLIFPALYWCIDSSLGLRTGIILMISGTINAYGKWILHLPRPFWLSPEVTAHVTETTFGAPSGHSQNAVVVWGLLASSIRKPWAWTVAVLLMFFIGISRMALGVHFYLDVLLGWLLGILILLGFLHFEAPVTAWLRQKSIIKQLIILFAISIGVWLLSSLILALIGDWQIPAEWIQNASVAYSSNEEAIMPLSMSGIITNAAVLFGLTGGAILMNARGGFQMKAEFWKLALRYVIGFIGVIIIWAGLDLIFPEGDDIIAYLFRYLRYGLAGMWISFGAPWIFVKTRLAESIQIQD